ncbi:flagellar biosynthesis protein FlhB [Marivita lacus]|uniref:Flagellar biosynthesis protein FlhB n=1 Tax=Marivita lacus TaxID=1323742 RepID=A0ABQ1LE46_9RHOB|nr:EscU/YscU/HrcU family type III secretion system export apparatus switch protein [Marivita lacus]GGC22619.1 flagellar biosynthesis protein FlhB [Marivita lacus]
MAESEDGQEKTEEPTQKRRDDARKDGKITTSTEMFVFATLGVGTLMLLLGKSALPDLADHWKAGFVIDPGQSLDSLMILRTGDLFWWVLASGLVLGIPMMITVLLAQTGMGGLNFAPKAFGVKLEKIDPLAGMKRMVSMKALVDLSKAVLKVTLLLGAGLLVLYPFLPAIMGMTMTDPNVATHLLGTVLVRVMAGLLIALAVIAAIDLGWQIHSNTKSLRMSRQDLKDEMKESEGSPELKAAMRRKQMEASRRASERKALADVPLATAIITNPTHFAIALKYDPAAGGAPVVLAMGKGPIAKEVIRRGRRAGVMTLRVPPLARALYFYGAIGREIPEQLYTAVAVILAHVWRLEQGQPEPTPDVDVPDALSVDEFGRRQQRT